ncbi:stage III sporulation protein AG [uncultured Clostridium sp.]|uniref:stage III sporulation protein AG n=1 Tax=uncultured Clostridium sp. TaxID=59620 RepID=UPI0028E88C8F|nr:stage III sporulation protein AG [uncultured Clostridium sp.]
MNLKKILEKIKNMENKPLVNKNVMNLIIVFLMGVLILLTANLFKTTATSMKGNLIQNDKNKEEVSTDGMIEEPTGEQAESELKFELKNILQQTEGVGRVEVMIYFSSGEEYVPAINMNDSTNTTEEVDNEGGRRNTTQKNSGTTVVMTTQGDKTEPMIVKKNKAKVTGVLIVAEGAEDKVTEYRIRKAVINLFNISDNKVNVYPMKK